MKLWNCDCEKSQFHNTILFFEQASQSQRNLFSGTLAKLMKNNFIVIYYFRKVGCIFMMVAVHMLPHAEFGLPHAEFRRTPLYNKFRQIHSLQNSSFWVRSSNWENRNFTKITNCEAQFSNTKQSRFGSDHNFTILFRGVFFWFPTLKSKKN